MKLLHNAWFWFTWFLVGLYFVIVYVVMPKLVTSVTSEAQTKSEPDYANTSVFTQTTSDFIVEN